MNTQEYIESLNKDKITAEGLLELYEQGLLKILPCPIGSEVYMVTVQTDGFDGTVYPVVIRATFRLDLLEAVGERVFLTREEADKKLKEIEKVLSNG